MNCIPSSYENRSNMYNERRYYQNPYNSNFNKYYVIRFLDECIRDYACVPHSWVKYFKGNYIVSVAYPEEDLSLTRKRIEDGEAVPKDWKKFSAEVVHQADDFIEGLLWMTENIEPQVKNTSVTTNNGGLLFTPQTKEVSLRKKSPLNPMQAQNKSLPVDFSGNTSVKSQRTETRESRNISSSVEPFLSTTLNKYNPSSARSASVPKPSCQPTDPQPKKSVDKLIRRSLSNDINNRQSSADQNPSIPQRTNNDSQIQDSQIQATPIRTDEGTERSRRQHVDPAITAHKSCPNIHGMNPGQLSEAPIHSSNGMPRKRNRDSQDAVDHSQNQANSAIETSIESIIIESSDEEMSDEELTDNSTNDATNVEGENNTRNVSAASRRSSIAHVHENTEKKLLQCSKTICEKIEHYSEKLEMFESVINQSIVGFFDIIQKGIETINEVCESKINELKEITTSASNKMGEKTIGDKKITESDKTESDNEVDSDSDCDDDYEVPKKKQKKQESFVLPPEYKRNDPSWTLKHKKSSKKTVEIIPNSCVYIDKNSLEYYKQTATDSKTLARNLMTEIFSESALKVCSLTGGKSYFHKKYTRPGLHERALWVLLDFVKLHAKAQNWDDFERTAVLNSLRNKLICFRPKQKSYANICTGVSKEKQKICTCAASHQR